MKTKTARRRASADNDRAHLDPTTGARADSARSTSLGRGGLENPGVFKSDKPVWTGPPSRRSGALARREGGTVRGPAVAASRSAPNGRPAKAWQLRLYVAGQTPKSLTAFSNLKKICENHLKDRYHIEVIDLVEQPQLSKGDQILAVPTLVRKLPQPVRKIIGDLSDTDRVLVGLDLRPAD